MVRFVPATENSDGSATERTLWEAAHAIRVSALRVGGQSTSTSS